jgi:hypothetical protein
MKVVTKSLKKYFLIVLAICLGILIVICLPLKSTVKSRDSSRIATLQQVGVALDMYHKAHNAYPMVTGSSNYERWKELRNFLSPYIFALPDDPSLLVENRQYDYKNSPDATSFVLKAVLDNSKRIELKSDLDGEIYGIWCGEQGNEREYCIGPQKSI